MSKSSIATALCLLAFFIKITTALPGCGKAGLRDPMSEDNSIQGARYFLSQGFVKTGGLPVYQGFTVETPVDHILHKTHVYTHYFPGPDYVLMVLFAVFGDSPAVISFARWLAIAHLMFAILLFAYCCERWIFQKWEWGKVWILGALFFAPAIYQWIYNLHGHAYSSSYILYGLSIGIFAGARLSKLKDKQKYLLAALCFLIGFLSQYMLLTGAFVVAFAPLAGFLLVPNGKGYREGIYLSAMTGVGLVLAFAVHFAQVAIALDSWHLAWMDQIGTAFQRAEDRGPPDRMQLIGIYSGFVAGAFRVSALTMLALGPFIIWADELKRSQKIRSVLALFGAGLASYAWIWVMKLHSNVHTHLNFRIFLLLFSVWLVIGVGFLARVALRRGAKVA